MSAGPFDPLRALRVLQEHGVRFVLVGGLAARLQGSPTVTNDLDLCYDRDRANLEYLAAALRELNATLRGAPDELPFLLEARTLAMGDAFTLATDAGNIDILGNPAGTSGYAQLMRTAETMVVGDGLEVAVAALEDLIAMKRAADRPKDRVEIEILEALLEERDAS